MIIKLLHNTNFRLQLKLIYFLIRWNIILFLQLHKFNSDLFFRTFGLIQTGGTMANIEIISSAEEFEQFVQKQPPYVTFSYHSTFIFCSRTAVVHFCADWSEPCKQFNESLQAFAADTKQLYFANVKAENVAELSAAYNVNAVPTVIFMKVC